MFNFLNALFLAGIAAGIVPVIIHLLNRRRLKRVEFSDLRFIAPLNQQRMRSLNLRRLLLLLLRVAIIVSVAVAMARPSIRGSFSKLLPAQARSSILLLVDTSYSMRMEGEDGTALDAAKAVAAQIVDAMERGDQANLMTFDDLARGEFERAVHDLALVRQRIAELQPSHGGTDWATAISAGLTALQQATEPNRELYVVSDFAGADLDSVRADLRSSQGDVRITLVPVAVERFVNVSIDDVHVPPGAVLVDEPVRVAVTVRNHDAETPADCAMQVELAGEPKGEASLRLGGGGVATQEFTIVAASAAASAGAVRKRIDRLPEDDVRYFVLPVLAQLKVVLVRAAGDAGGGFFVARALAPTRDGRTPVQLTEVEATRFASRDLEGTQVVVVTSDAVLGDVQAQVLSDFVRDGGGLVLMSGQRATAEIANRLVLERLGAVRIRGVTQQGQGFVNFEDLRATGILTGFKEPELRELERVRFTRYAALTPGGAARTVLRFSGGTPAAIEAAHGEGKYMLFGFDAGMDGSDLAVSPMFLPLLHRAVVYLAGETGRQKLAYTVGERIEIQVPLAAAERRAAAEPGANRHGGEDWAAGEDPRWAQAGGSGGGAVARDAGSGSDSGSGTRGGSDAGADTGPGAAAGRDFTVTTPSGRKNAVVARHVGKMAVVAYEDTREPGHYVFEGAGRRIARAVNVDTRESDLRRADLDDLAQRLGIEVAGTLEGEASIARSVREARHGKELYKLIVAMVLVLMTVELLLSRAAKQSEA